MVLNATRLMPALCCVYCGIAWYFSNSACHPASVSGGMTPVTGRHSTIDRPDSVSRVVPPTSTSAMTSAATAQSQSRIARWWLSLAGAMRAGPYRGRLQPAIATEHAHSHPQADRYRRPPGTGGGLGAAGDGLRAEARRLAQPAARNRLLHCGRARLGAAGDAADQLDVAPRPGRAGGR